MTALEDRTVPAVITYSLDTNLDTAFAKFDNVIKMAPVDAAGNVSLRAVIEYASANPETGNWNQNRYCVDLNNIMGQTITLSPNLGTLKLKSNFDFLGGSNVIIERNVAQAAFGLFDVAVGTEAHFQNLTLQGGKAVSGGAILVRRGAELQMQFCTLYNNEALGGGAIAADTQAAQDGAGLPGAKIFLGSCLLALNRGLNSGGAILVYSATTLGLSGCSFLGNSATGVLNGQGFGGAIAAAKTPTSISFSNFTGNEAGTNGGGLYVYECDLTTNGGQIHGNTAGGDGGGIYVDADDKTTTLTNVRMTQNGATNKGGGAYIFKGTLAGSLTELTGNTAGVAIPGIAFKQGNGATAPITVPMFQQTKVAD